MGRRRCTVAQGRSLVLDDVGDPAGTPVVYLHGTPDARQARHPDDGLAAAAGVRLLAVDRPGFGESDPHPGAALGQLGHDLGAVLDDLELPSAALFGWSSGGLAALAAATTLGRRCTCILLVGPLPPVEAYADPALVADLGPSRRTVAELAGEVPAADLAAELAPYVLPDPLTPDVAREHVLEGAEEEGRAELAAVPGALDAVVTSLLANAGRGTDGVEQDLRHQLGPGLDLGQVRAPVRTVHGSRDPVSPPAVGRWLAARLPGPTEVEVVEGGGHHLLFPRWAELMRWLADPAR